MNLTGRNWAQLGATGNGQRATGNGRNLNQGRLRQSGKASMKPSYANIDHYIPSLAGTKNASNQVYSSILPADLSSIPQADPFPNACIARLLGNSKQSG